jgi:hypothetical protein
VNGPVRHAHDCDYHCDQYEAECTCRVKSELHQSTSAPDAPWKADILMELEPMEKHVEDMIKKAGEAAKPDDAMKFSQAALNAANAIIGLNGMKKTN